MRLQTEAKHKLPKTLTTEIRIAEVVVDRTVEFFVQRFQTIKENGLRNVYEQTGREERNCEAQMNHFRFFDNRKQFGSVHGDRCGSV